MEMNFENIVFIIVALSGFILVAFLVSEVMARKNRINRNGWGILISAAVVLMMIVVTIGHLPGWRAEIKADLKENHHDGLAAMTNVNALKTNVNSLKKDVALLARVASNRDENQRNLERRMDSLTASVSNIVVIVSNRFESIEGRIENLRTASANTLANGNVSLGISAPDITPPVSITTPSPTMQIGGQPDKTTLALMQRVNQIDQEIDLLKTGQTNIVNSLHVVEKKANDGLDGLSQQIAGLRTDVEKKTSQTSWATLLTQPDVVGLTNIFEIQYNGVLGTGIGHKETDLLAVSVYVVAPGAQKDTVQKELARVLWEFARREGHDYAKSNPNNPDRQFDFHKDLADVWRQHVQRNPWMQGFTFVGGSFNTGPSAAAGVNSNWPSIQYSSAVPIVKTDNSASRSKIQ